MSTETLNFLFPEMAHEVIESKSFLWLTRSLDIICASIILFVFFYHIYVLYSHDVNRTSSSEPSSNNSGTRSRKKGSISIKSRSRSASTKPEHEYIAKWSTALHTLSLLFIVFSFITIMMLLLNIWSVFPLHYSCDYIVYVLCCAFHLSKSTFYAICIVRLQVAFGVSAYRYSLCQIYALLGFVAIYSLVIIIGTPSIVYGKWLTVPHVWCHVHIYEHGSFIPIAVLCWIVMDVFISILLLYLFLKPIRRLLSVITINKRLANLMIKYSILTWISIILSMTSLLLYLWKHITTLIEINLPFTCICVVLMHVKYDNMFNCCCFVCTRCCKSLCRSHKSHPKEPEAQTKHIEFGTRTESTKANAHSQQESVTVTAPMTPCHSQQPTPVLTNTGGSNVDMEYPPCTPVMDNEESLEVITE